MTEKDGTSTVSPALAGAIALVVAALAAVGVSGNALTRAVRNNPDDIANSLQWALIAALVLALAALVSPLISSLNRIKGLAKVGQVLLFAISLTTLVVATIMAVRTGARSVNAREAPEVTLSAASDAEGINITIDVSGAGLRTEDQLEVHVVGVKPYAVEENAPAFEVSRPIVKLCEAHRYAWSSAAATDASEKGAPDPYQRVPAKQGDLLYFSRFGPDQNGNGHSKIEIRISRQLYVGVCAFAIVPQNAAEGDEYDRAAAYVRLPTSNAAAR